MNPAPVQNKRKLLMVPFASLEGHASGANVKAKSTSAQKDLYFKNCCVACLSAAEYIHPETDVALITNIEVPEPYANLLKSNNVLIIHAPFDSFKFESSYTYNLAFYKLCALYYVTHELDYDYYAYLDSDVYVQSDFSIVWEECKDRILMFDVNHGLQVPNYRHLISEIQSFDPEKSYITHFGGEFFAASKEMARSFSESCLVVFQEMLHKNFKTTHGDEFIVSIVADEIKSKMKNASAYVGRYWTRAFRLLSTNYKYDPVIVLHVPGEKNDGMIRLFNYYKRHHKMPPQKTVWRMLHLHRRNILISIKVLLDTILQKRHSH